MWFGRKRFCRKILAPMKDRSTKKNQKSNTGKRQLKPRSSTTSASALLPVIPANRTFFTRRDLWFCASLIAAIVAVYAPVRSYDFVGFDDPAYVKENPNIAAGLTWQAVRWAFTTGYFANWHPFTWLSHMIDIQLYALHAG